MRTRIRRAMVVTVGSVIAAGLAAPALSSPAVAGTATASVIARTNPAPPAPLAPKPMAPAPAPEAKAPRTLRPGASGEDVRRMQQRLIQLHFDPGKADGKYGSMTVPAVWAFQKVNGMSPDSAVGPKTWKALDNPRTPKPLVSKGAANRVEIDIKRQLLYVYKSGALRLVSHISSGSGQRYCVEGRCQYARTPTGNFNVTRKAHGWETSKLGKLYNSIYFYGGYAMHGSYSVPTYPASHGCVRIPMHTADLLPKLVPLRMAVYVRR